MSRFQSIMLIDDSEIDNLVNKHIITKNELSENLIVYSSAREALDYLQRCIKGEEQIKPDLLLLDINMPIMNGFGFLVEFGKLPMDFINNIKIVMLTSSVDPNDIRKANESNLVHGFVSKPLSADLLMNV
jgi:CheY-like chemotaxis protein